jgi:hypothetical protein
VLVGISGLSVTIHYRSKYKHYKQLYEGMLKPKHKPKEVFKSKNQIEAERREEYLVIRSQVLLRDHFRCQECGYYKHLEVHHVVPRSKGGTDDPENLMTLCTRCHKKIHGFRDVIRKKKRHTRRNKRKKFRRYINKHKDIVRKEVFPIRSMEDVHPRQEDHSPEAEDRRQRLYAKWENNQLNQTTRKPDTHN